MLLTLEECQHATVVAYGTDSGRGTCMACYRRLRAVGRVLTDGHTEFGWQTDTPVSLCNHAHKKPILDSARSKPFQDALCLSCGSVLRHPNGPGRWHEVIFNGLVIKEEPFG